MDEYELDCMASLLMRQLGAALPDGALPHHTQIVVRPILTWPDGKPGIWIVVNWPN